MMLAGIAQTKISPPKGLMLGGYARGNRHNRGIHDPLFATALYLEQGETRLLWVSVDILTIPGKLVRQIRSLAARNTGIAESHILLCCTHTHSGPRMGTKGDTGEAYLAYEAWLKAALLKLMKSAMAQPFPAKLAVGAGSCGAEQGVGGNRFVRGGVADPTVGVLAVKDEADRLRLVLANYALHPTVLHEDNVLVSADYPGGIRRHVQKAYPGTLFGFLQGASGNQSTRYFRRSQGYEEVERIGSAIGEAVVNTLPQLSFGEPVLSMDFAASPLILRSFPEEAEILEEIRVKNAREQALIAQNAPYADIQDAHNMAVGAECLLDNAREAEALRQSMNETNDHCRMAALKIGEDLFILSQGELFLEYALDIRSAGKGKVFIVTLTNGYLPGYVYTRQAMGCGGYEVDNSMLAPETGEALARAGRALVEKMQ